MDNILEEWRPVVGWEGLYEVSNYGRVRSLDRNYIGPRNSKRVSKGRILNGEKVSNTGYIRVMLQNGKKRIERESVHRLVAFAFQEICGEYFEGAQINHKDETRDNNVAWNLEWCTAYYNCTYGGRISRIVNTRSKVIIQLTLNDEYVAEYKGQGDASRKTGIPQTLISRCIRGKMRQTNGYKWKIKQEP